MKSLGVDFELAISIGLPDENYSGKITLFPAPNSKGKTFYFKAFSVYNEDCARFTVFNDEDHKKVLASGTGVPGQGTKHPITRKKIVAYNFGMQLDDPQMGMIFVVTNIVSEGIHFSDEEFARDHHHTQLVFRSRWVGRFDQKMAVVIDSFSKEFSH